MSEGEKQNEKVAAGGVVIDRQTSHSPRVLVVHRPRYDDWSFPKGGVKPGETIEEAAIREVREETGIESRITGELLPARYNYRTRNGRVRPKIVHYFLMEAVGGQFQVTGDEVDRVEWLDAREAERRLSYPHDKDLLYSVLANEP